MNGTKDRNGLEILDRETCLRLLAGTTLGRIGISSGALPVILPVNFRLGDEHILIRTSPGTKLDAALANAIVAFEIDDMDAFDHAGWSVSVTGRARLLPDDDAQRLTSELGLARWAPSPDGHVIAISLDVVTGRRLNAGLHELPGAPA
jgi:nitroimidazol reductase NimA-like FMN-containing flavoprotein (pyridoxamine 5'-phosphate oxidase superfamily)